MTVNVAEVTALALSVTNSGTAVLATGNELQESAATLAVNEPPLALIVTAGGVPEAPTNVTLGFADVTLYGETPPATTNILSPPSVHLTDAAAGVTVNVGGGVTGAVIVTATVPDALPALALIVADVSDVTAAAVNLASAKPSVVCANGSMLPLLAGLAVKLTVVPSGTGLPALVNTRAVIVDDPPDATV